ncbi:ankyrin repeat domain-containing protein [Streptomyces sp. NBC_01235]|uniref:ankyrin repeat domain-containing protein n=1 Tax=Streptomyces sp. NBC_01235 TaxID=2903788 RepID=UPI002E120B27|nr:ankyrin repeat domain-containing protein [Streptomyces sp. NBC_01235]
MDEATKRNKRVGAGWRDEPIEAWKARQPTAAALYAAVRQGDVARTRALVEAGADPDQLIGEYDDWTPLTLAAGEGHLAVVELLLDAGVHPDSQNRFGLLPVVLAATSGPRPHSDIVDLLLRRGAGLDAPMKGRPAREWLDRARTEHDRARSVDPEQH